jgi:hypothetical protein
MRKDKRGHATNGADHAKTQAVEPLVQVKTRFIDTGCDWTKPISVSKGDVLTDDTARQILAHNQTGSVKCGWRPSAGK